MSGLFKPLLLTLGGLSVFTVLWILARMDAVDGDRVALRLRAFQTIRYFVWLTIEIAKANLQVTRVVLSRDMAIRQHMFRVPSTQKSDLGQVIFANSITLTPGTISVETEQSEILVHALCYSDTDMEALAEMDRQVSRIETERA